MPLRLGDEHPGAGCEGGIEMNHVTNILVILCAYLLWAWVIYLAAYIARKGWQAAGK